MHKAGSPINLSLIPGMSCSSFSHINKAISSAEVIMKIDEVFISAQNKICDITPIIFGLNIHTRVRTENFENLQSMYFKNQNKWLPNR